MHNAAECMNHASLFRPVADSLCTASQFCSLSRKLGMRFPGAIHPILCKNYFFFCLVSCQVISNQREDQGSKTSISKVDLAKQCTYVRTYCEYASGRSPQFLWLILLAIISVAPDGHSYPPSLHPPLISPPSAITHHLKISTPSRPTLIRPVSSEGVSSATLHFALRAKGTCERKAVFWRGRVQSSDHQLLC